MQIGVDSQRAVENKRVFVVDSDDIASTALQFMLADENETHVFPDLGAALEKARDWPPNLILLGAAIVAQEGQDVVARITSELSEVKVLLIGNGAAPSLEEARALGAVGVLHGPLELATVRRKVDAQLGRRASLGIAVAVV